MPRAAVVILLFLAACTPARVTRAWVLTGHPNGVSGRTWKWCKEEIPKWLEAQPEYAALSEEEKACMLAQFLDECLWMRGAPLIQRPDPLDPGVYDPKAAIADMSVRTEVACGEEFGVAEEHALYDVHEVLRSRFKREVGLSEEVCPLPTGTR